MKRRFSVLIFFFFLRSVFWMVLYLTLWNTATLLYPLVKWLLCHNCSPQCVCVCVCVAGTSPTPHTQIEQVCERLTLTETTLMSGNCPPARQCVCVRICQLGCSAASPWKLCLCLCAAVLGEGIQPPGLDRTRESQLKKKKKKNSKDMHS